MSWIFVDKEKGSDGEMRQQMRRNMRNGGNYRNYGSGSTSYHEGYRQGYRHGWEDSEDETDMEMRRSRDSRGRYI